MKDTMITKTDVASAPRAVATAGGVTTVSTPSRAYGYAEVPAVDVDRLDVREQLRANLRQLEDLHGRLQYVLSEVQTLIRPRG